MPTNEHVEGGLFDHRRVDEANLANKTRKEGDANRSRGVHLSSETLGVSGILDVIESATGNRIRWRRNTAPRHATTTARRRPETTTPCSSAPRPC